MTAESKKRESSAGTDTTKPQPFLKQLIVTKTAPIYLEKANMVNGRNWDRWVFISPPNTYRIMKVAGDAEWSRQGESTFGDFFSYDKSDFEELEWIGEKNYKGIEMVDKQLAYAFERDGNVAFTRREKRDLDIGAGLEGQGSGTSPTKTYTSHVWLDVKTLLPIKVDNGDEVRTYTYGPAPASRLSPPPDVLNALRNWMTDIKRMSR